jgi:hypothetical protein
MRELDGNNFTGTVPECISNLAATTAGIIIQVDYLSILHIAAAYGSLIPVNLRAILPLEAAPVTRCEAPSNESIRKRICTAAYMSPPEDQRILDLIL